MKCLERNCLNCNVLFSGRKGSDFCSKECKAEKEKKDQFLEHEEKYKNPEDYVVCPVCKLKMAKISGQHAKLHGFANLGELQNHFPDHPTISKTQIRYQSERIRGDKNPAKNHGGRLSPFSKKFLKYKDGEAEQKISDLAKRANETKIKNNNCPVTEVYYIKRGASKEEAAVLLKDRQTTFSKDICAKKYGEEEGTRRWKERQDKWQAKLEAKGDEEKAEINRKKLSSSTSSVSVKERTFIQDVKNLLPNAEIETQFKVRNGVKYFAFDLKIGNKLIEFNGDYWHANPAIYSEESLINFRGKGRVPVSLVWESDKIKRETAERNGYKLFVAWERDYALARETLLENILKFLND